MKEELRINVDGNGYMIHFEQGENWNMMYNGEVYPTIEVEHVSLDGSEVYEKVICYESNFCSDLIEQFDKVEVRCLFEFSYNWRGVWEGRIYPKDEEYWSEELREMADLWDEIEKVFKQKIKDNNPNKQFD